MSKKELIPENAETLILSSILREPQRVFNLNGLKPFMLSNNTHISLLDNMISMAESNLQPNKQLLESKLSSTGKLELVGGTAFLDHLISQPEQSSENVDEYIEIVKESYRTREFMKAINSVNLETIQRDGVTEIVSEMQTFMDKLMTNSGSGLTRQIGSLIDEVYENIEKRTENPGIRGVPTGFKSLDYMTGGYNAGDLWIIAGRPGMGKTATVCNSILNLSKIKAPSIVFSKEMNNESLVERLLSIETGIALSDIRLGTIKKDGIEIIKDRKEEFREYPIFLDANFGADVSYIESAVRKFVQLHGVKVVFIDYLQLLAERDENQTQEIGRITKKLKLLAEKLQICIVVLSQLNRLVESRENKRPILSDMRQSGNIEEDADVVVGLYRDESYNGKESKLKGVIEFILLKQRNGGVGTIPLKFNADNITISN